MRVHRKLRAMGHTSLRNKKYCSMTTFPSTCKFNRLLDLLYMVSGLSTTQVLRAIYAVVLTRTRQIRVFSLQLSYILWLHIFVDLVYIFRSSPSPILLFDVLDVFVHPLATQPTHAVDKLNTTIDTIRPSENEIRGNRGEGTLKRRRRLKTLWQRLILLRAMYHLNRLNLKMDSHLLYVY